jgi:two-component system, NtrC family, nitrogen regulation response regulator NtrX
MPRDILIVDDEKDISDLIADILKDEGYTTRAVSSSTLALEAIDETIPQAIILDIWLQGSELDGLGVLEIIKRKYPHVPVIMISGHGTIETAVNAIKIGAYDYIEKPFTEDRLLVIVKRACEAAKLLYENTELKRKVGATATTELIGNSASVIQLRQGIDRVATTSSRVLITGPAGSGKESVARLIHHKSKRSHEPFVVLNAASIAQDKIDTELFGSDDPAGIYGENRKIGILERAHGGTLFIDEVADMPLLTQNKILRFLQEQSFERPVTNRLVKIDVRVIAASSRNLAEEIAAGRLRQDLYYRLNVVPLRIPPLSERREDIALLCDYFIKKSADSSGLPLCTMGEDALAAMQMYNWPGNLRQLRNIIEWLMIMVPKAANRVIRASMLPPELSSEGFSIARPDANGDMMSMPLREARELFECQYLMAQINRFNGNISRTSAFVGMERSALHRKLKSLNLVGANEG